MLSLSLLLFGILYRYAVRGDDNPMLKQGAVGAFAITRAVSQLRAPENCVPIPLDCGPPLGYFSWPMLIQGMAPQITSAADDSNARQIFYLSIWAIGAESCVQGLAAYGVAALAIEFAFSK